MLIWLLQPKLVKVKLFALACLWSTFVCGDLRKTLIRISTGSQVLLSHLPENWPSRLRTTCKLWFPPISKTRSRFVRLLVACLQKNKSVSSHTSHRLSSRRPVACGRWCLNTTISICWMRCRWRTCLCLMKLTGWSRTVTSRKWGIFSPMFTLKGLRWKTSLKASNKTATKRKPIKKKSWKLWNNQTKTLMKKRLKKVDLTLTGPK